ncbi:MAG TPA: envelope integrity protein Cei [Pseudonocardiaceae bacterium]|nr:envelope integrity protein Cei [Pseudonocardiaceae bacterium]
MAAAGLSRERRRAPYRRRKPIPAIVIVALLLIAAVVVWIKVIHKADNVDQAIACPASTVAGAAGDQTLGYTALDKVTPAAPNQIQYRVYNGSTQRGAANQAAIALTGLGFQQATTIADDPLYPQQNMACVGQIRFGSNGQAAARTLSLVLPCTQLIKDNRQDSTVDVAIGKKFSTVVPNTDALSALHQLSAYAASHPAQQGGQQAQGSSGPVLSQSLLSNAHNSTC